MGELDKQQGEKVLLRKRVILAQTLAQGGYMKVAGANFILSGAGGFHIQAALQLHAGGIGMLRRQCLHILQG